MPVAAAFFNIFAPRTLGKQTLFDRATRFWNGPQGAPQLRTRHRGRENLPKVALFSDPCGQCLVAGSSCSFFFWIPNNSWILISDGFLDWNWNSGRLRAVSCQPSAVSRRPSFWLLKDERQKFPSTSKCTSRFQGGSSGPPFRPPSTSAENREASTPPLRDSTGLREGAATAG